uniref:Uncharacterized protein isoform X2 n=1 Tax=Nicotiana tabacum TaxID=4097 RepID=A0A1S3X9J8_TOBAC|nr:PREDICTED: uncharacterized protein LOC107762715 isoform X2 [Nicotiana tabacum]
MTRKSLSNAWFQRDLGFFYWVLDMFRCKRLLGNVEATFMGEAMEAEEDAERLLRRTEKRAFQAFKKAVADSSPASIPLPLRVEPKPKSGIRQQDLLKRVLEVKPKKQKVSTASDGSNSPASTQAAPSNNTDSNQEKQKEPLPARSTDMGDETIADNPMKSLLVAYESSDED